MFKMLERTLSSNLEPLKNMDLDTKKKKKIDWVIANHS